MQDLISGILQVWTELSNWFVTAMPNVQAVFYQQDVGLTFVGVLSVAALGVSVFFLIFGLLRKFLKFK